MAGKVLNQGQPTPESVDAASYGAEMAEKYGTVTAVKHGAISVRRAEPGEQVATVAGDGTKETVNTAKLGDYVVTKLGDDLKPALNQNGHENVYIMSGATLAKKYLDSDGNKIDSEKGTEGICRPDSSIPQKWVQVDKDIRIMAPWGEAMVIRKGGYLNVTNPSNVYGISEKDFNDTYKPL